MKYYHATTPFRIHQPISPYSVISATESEVLDSVVEETSPALGLDTAESYSNQVKKKIYNAPAVHGWYKFDIPKPIVRCEEKTKRRLYKPPYVINKPSNGQLIKLNDRDLDNILKWIQDNPDTNMEALQNWNDLWLLLERKRNANLRKETLRKK